MSCVRSRRGGKLSSRLTRTYALLFAATTLVLSLCVYLVSRQFLIGRRQDELVSAAQNIAEVFCEELSEGYEPTDPNVLWELSTDEGLSLLLLSPEGEVLNQAGYFEVQAEPLLAGDGGVSDYRQADGRRLLVYRRSVPLNGEETAVLAVVRSVDQEYAFLDMLAGLLLALNALGAAIALGVGRVMAARMLRPVSGMITRANALNAEVLTTRLEVPEADDELRRLALTLNQMLDRVQDAFERQRRFTQDASHELRTPLSVLQGNAELLSRWAKDDPEARDACVAAILRQTGYMKRLIESLLFLTRGDSCTQLLHPQTIDLAACLGEVAEERRLLDAAHAYTLQAAEGVFLRADETLLRQLLLILLDNAAKYTPEGGEIRMESRLDDCWAEVSVRDQGCGVPEEQLERIFDRFYRVDKARARENGGTGLGLPIARTIVRLHGGTISAQNAPGGGLIVTARFTAGRDESPSD